MMHEPHSRNLLLLTMFTFNLHKFLEWTLGTAVNNIKINESHWTSEDVFYNHSTLNALCSGGYSELVWVCSLPSQMEDFGNIKKHDRVLVFRFNSIIIKIFLSTHQISLPNANFSFRARVDDEVPVYREDISKDLYVFYGGDLVFLDISLPFSAEWDRIHFKGITYFLNVYFEFFCTNKSESSFYKMDQCFYCSATCTDTESQQKSNNTSAEHHDMLNIDYEYPELRYSQAFYTAKTKLHRKHRNAAAFPPTPLSCVLHLVADHLFHKHIGDGSILKTINAMFSVVNDADALFRSTDFDGDLQGDNIGFIVGKVTVFTDTRDPNYNLSQPILTAKDYLKEFSYYDFGDYCLGVAFTYREFRGLAGSAFQAYSDESLPGGICQERLKHNFDTVSFNTAVLTFLNFGKKMKKRQVVLILAHELGHSIGASHDVTTECHPDGEEGNFLMSATINFGELPNNPRFSVCSIRSMLPVIKKKGSCLLYSDQISHCGNSIPEIGEECDCGTSNICHFIDPCCTPADVEEGVDKPCTVRRSKGKLCSPKVNPCCTDSCTYIPLRDHRLCNQLYDCSYLSVCDGLSGHCPFSGPAPNGTLCSNGFKVCNMGTCSQSVCEHHNLTSCVCTKQKGQCKLCCKDPRTLHCEPASSYGILSSSGEINQEPGEQCYNNGFCDLLLKCLSASDIVVPEIAVFGFKTSAEFQEYIKNYWLYYVFAAFCIIFIISVVLLPYRLDDVRYMKALRYGKMLAVFATGEHQTKIYRKTITDIDDYYTFELLKLHSACESKDYIEAVGRLKLFFPEVHIAYLSRIAKLSATESTAFKILLLQGFKMRTFTKSKPILTNCSNNRSEVETEKCVVIVPKVSSNFCK